MRRILKRLALLLLTVSVIGAVLAAALSAPAPVQAEDAPPEDLKRKTTLDVSFTSYEWWLVRYSDNDITCRFLVDHEGLPIEDEINTWCGATLYNEWKNTQGCTLAEGQEAPSCSGLYLFQFSSYPGHKTVDVELPLPSVWVSISGCSPQPPDNRCDSAPYLLLTGEEPLPNEMIIAIQGTVDGDPFVCNGASCEIPLAPTGQQGIQVEFWAQSSFGDESEHYTAQVRVTAQGDFMSPEGVSADSPVYYVDVLSSQWRGAPLASCADIWQSFPDVGGPPAWLISPAEPADLSSSTSLYYLAGMLIANGEVDASVCADGGLQSAVTASECGLDEAYDEVVAWQNQFDNEIFNTALDTGIPAQLLKNIFSRESQFWPGIYHSYKEAGLGQLTENGADTVLLWNPDFFDQYCPLALHQDRCDLGFANLSTEEQRLLRGSLVNKVNAACEDCPAGIDLTQAQFSVQVFAESLAGNCEQVNRLYNNITGGDAGQSTSYSDLWRFTLINYNAGSGCLGNALQTAFNQGQPLDWEHVTASLEEACQPATGYVDDIVGRSSGPQPTPTSWVYPGQPLPQITAVRLPTRTPGAPGAEVTPAPTVTPGGPTVTPSPTQSAGSTPDYPAVPTYGGGDGYPEPSEPTPIGNYP